MKKTAILLAIMLLVLSAVGCSQQAAEPSSPPSETVELHISAAASLTESMTKVAALYEQKNSGVKIVNNFASSGTLQTQIEEGAPADLFISAAQKQMDALENEGLILNDSRIDLLENKVVLIVPKDSDIDLSSFEDCLTDKVSMIAIGDPANVPVGQYAQDVFTYLNGWDVISAKANLAADVKEVLSWTETGNVDCGVVYSTDAATSDGVRVVCEAPANSHKPVVYPAAVVKASENADAAAAFISFLSSDEVKQIFSENGFSVQ
jgi:molybdate transport system substrate-binding protein